MEDADVDVAIPVLSMRALITTKEAGVIIGKGGKNVVEIRNESGAKVTISEHGQGAVERIITITGTLDCVAKAFALVSTKIIEELIESERGAASGPTVDPSDLKSRHCSVRLLIANSRMGSVIGKQGNKIKEIQEESVARITASEEPMPGSTERVVTISGVIDSIHRAVYFIGKVLQDNQDRPGSNVPYRPMAPVGRPAFPMATPSFGYPGVPLVPAHRGAVPVQVQQIFIPNDMVGSIIGKGGTKINEIRQRSGSQIRIADAQAASSERLVTITGSPEANQLALYLLYSRLEMEKQKAQVA
ncbi:hypothetical protein M427DRAFT_99716 [Gonapodya prolifera JEL478]|uniref:K Homology domain-containing protein n=1 Tax=Gonapodya prolifera (strain JEL478) TaxID=1344416 RepID=A0A139AD59_GONPJ|nr:hypothetical protein M427DRAFT_99716 [Gonapodya prolifera JEL478]|eukprot:KXS14353.1 hypothetical protein M427DRAFT_99716 [Gonapodya prolifera JEL478]